MRIYAVFLSRESVGIGWPYMGYDDEGTRRSITQHLKERFPDVEFLGGKIIRRYDPKEMWELKNGVREADGLLVYVIGNPTVVDAGVELIEIGKPTILANFIYGGDQGFIRIYERVRGRGLRVVPVSSTSPEDLDRALEIMRGVHSLRGGRILVFTFDAQEVERGDEHKARLQELMGGDMSKLSEDAMEHIAPLIASDTIHVDVHGVDQAIQWRRNEDKYRENLAGIFGLEMIRPKPEELYAYYEKASEKEAERIAGEWIKGAKSVEANRQVIVNSAKLYLALKKFMQDTGSVAVGLECFPVLVSGRIPAFPCLAFFKLNDEGSTGVCEADMDSTVSMLLGRYVAGRPGHVSNYSLDLSHNRATYLHCVAPTKMYGPEGPAFDYHIAPHGEAHFIGASPVVEFPAGEDVTTIKVSVFSRKMLIRHGKSIGLVKDDKACRNKLLVDTNARKILEKHDHDVFGWHTVSFLGDLREDFKSAARLLGLEVIEEDV